MHIIGSARIHYNRKQFWETGPFGFDFNSIGIDSGFFLDATMVTVTAANESVVVFFNFFFKKKEP